MLIVLRSIIQLAKKLTSVDEQVLCDQNYLTKVRFSLLHSLLLVVIMICFYYLFSLLYFVFFAVFVLFALAVLFVSFVFIIYLVSLVYLFIVV